MTTFSSKTCWTAFARQLDNVTPEIKLKAWSVARLKWNLLNLAGVRSFAYDPVTVDFSQRVNDVGPPPRINQLDALELDQEVLATFHSYLADTFKFFLKYSSVIVIQISLDHQEPSWLCGSWGRGTSSAGHMACYSLGKRNQCENLILCSKRQRFLDCSFSVGLFWTSCAGECKRHPISISEISFNLRMDMFEGGARGFGHFIPLPLPSSDGWPRPHPGLVSPQQLFSSILNALWTGSVQESFSTKIWFQEASSLADRTSLPGPAPGTCRRSTWRSTPFSLLQVSVSPWTVCPMFDQQVGEPCSKLCPAGEQSAFSLPRSTLLGEWAQVNILDNVNHLVQICCSFGCHSSTLQLMSFQLENKSVFENALKMVSCNTNTLILSRKGSTKKEETTFLFLCTHP